MGLPLYTSHSAREQSHTAGDNFPLQRRCPPTFPTFYTSPATPHTASPTPAHPTPTTRRDWTHAARTRCRAPQARTTCFSDQFRPPCHPVHTHTHAIPTLHLASPGPSTRAPRIRAVLPFPGLHGDNALAFHYEKTFNTISPRGAKAATRRNAAPFLYYTEHTLTWRWIPAHCQHAHSPTPPHHSTYTHVPSPPGTISRLLPAEPVLRHFWFTCHTHTPAPHSQDMAVDDRCMLVLFPGHCAARCRTAHLAPLTISPRRTSVSGPP